ncbi:hypothetical protein [Aeromonas sp. s8]|uniref:hypothetical protein n=1 Tax=Aeromonas sp. s8 TaxID=3138489 RepID=UPI0034A4DC76
MAPTLLCSDVFGVSPNVSSYSYVDRGDLDEEISRQLKRKTHIALRGESKCGKSWLRQKTIDDPIIVQCRLKTTHVDIYTDILSQLGIRLIIEDATKNTIKGKVEASGGIGIKLITQLKLSLGLNIEEENTTKGQIVGHDINDLNFIAKLINNSNRRVVIEDFHYLSVEERKNISFDLKALWDYQCFFVIIGIWTKSNLLIHLNPDLSGRMIEIPVSWSDSDLEKVISKGSLALNINFSTNIKKQIIADAYHNVGLLQALTLAYLDEEKIYEASLGATTHLDDETKNQLAAISYAEQLNTKYQKFATDISTGIRTRKDSTGIYAHAMAAIIMADDNKLLNGFNLDEIFHIVNKRQPRIQKQNLKTILQKLEDLQVDADGRGLVLAFNTATNDITTIDRTLLFYRKYVTITWPWEDLINEVEAQNETKIFLGD